MTRPGPLRPVRLLGARRWFPLRFALVAMAFGTAAWWVRPGMSSAQPSAAEVGESLYVARCSTCHGPEGIGSADGPPLAAVGPASIDFALSTGRMPLGRPDQQPVRQKPVFDRSQIDAIISYLSLVAPGGPPIPEVDPSRGELARGLQAFIANCSGCHGASGGGDSIGGGQIAPSLTPATATQIAEAIRIGPGAMPRFGDRTLTEEDVDSIARYLLWLRDSPDPGGLGLGRVGPVVEGFVTFVVGMGILLVVIRWAGTRT